MHHSLVLACSPRAVGNSDAAADIGAEALRTAGADVLPLRLRDHPLRPCLGCGWCDTRPGRCVLDGPGDNALFLFDTFARADVLLLTSPVYFYGPPAQFKAFIDRCQTFWTVRPDAAPKPAFPVLIGARTKGERLFEASLLILRSVLPVLGFAVQEPLLLRTLDGPEDLRGKPEACEQVRLYAKRAAGK